MFLAFWGMKMHAATWSLRVSIFNTYPNALGFGENIVSEIYRRMSHVVDAQIHMFLIEQHHVTIWILSYHFSWFLCHQNVARKNESAALNFQY